MGATRRKFTLEFRTEAAHRVIDTGRSVREVANELSVLENSLSKWVRDERRVSSRISPNRWHDHRGYQLDTESASRTHLAMAASGGPLKT
jgi:transposase-like protein